jgi:uncharacterized protein
MKYLIFISFFILSIYSCDSEIKQEEKSKRIEYYPNGKIKEQGQLLENNNKKTGEWTEFYESGNIAAVGTYNNGKKDGLWTLYYPSGIIMQEVSYVSGIKSGSFSEYSEDGILHQVGQIKDGKRNGKQIVYYPNGQIASKTDVVNDLIDGKQIDYYKNGQIKVDSKWMKNIPIDTAKIYSIDGELIAVFVTDSSGELIFSDILNETLLQKHMNE